MLPMVISNIIEVCFFSFDFVRFYLKFFFLKASVSLKRIREFLLKENLNENCISNKNIEG